MYIKRRIIKNIVLIIGIVLFVFIYCFVLSINPLLRRSSESIRNDMLKLTAIGMNMDKVIDIIEKKKSWEVLSINYSRGYVDYRGHDEHKIGVRTELGHSNAPLVAVITGLTLKSL